MNVRRNLAELALGLVKDNFGLSWAPLADALRALTSTNGTTLRHAAMGLIHRMEQERLKPEHLGPSAEAAYWLLEERFPFWEQDDRQAKEDQGGVEPCDWAARERDEEASANAWTEDHR